MRNLCKKAIRLVLLAVIVALFVATPVLAYTYSAQVSITESTGTSYTMLPVSWAQNNDWLADNGYMTATALDTRVQTVGGLNKPWMVTEDKMLTAIPVGASSQTNLIFATGESAATSMDIITGYGGYVTVADAAALELGNNFSLEFNDLYLDASSADDILVKNDSFDFTSDGTGTVSAMIYDYTTMVETNSRATSWRVPSAEGQTFQATATAYVSQIEVNVTLNPLTNVTFRLYATAAGAPTGGILATSALIANIPSTGWNTVDFLVPYEIINGTTYAVIAVGGAGAGWRYENTNPYANGSEYNTITFDGDGNITGSVQQAANDLNLRVNYSPYVEASGVSTGEHDITVASDGTDFTLTIDTVEEDSVAIGAMSAPDNGNNWVIGSAITPYYGYYKHTVSGTLIAWYQPVAIISGTTLPDREGVAQNGVITWGANPTGIRVTVGSMVSSGQSGSLVDADTSTGDLLPVAGGSDWDTAPSVGGSLLTHPLRPLIVAVSDNTTLSERQVWVLFGVTTVIFVTVLVGANVRGHHLITGIAASAVIILMVVWTIFPILSLAVIIIAVWGGLISERSPSL
ncbi:MAG: hypothetical protein PHQ43_05365 [Dehalococcoidales bacterium]|nr:hypothetical protein [Dehalococcoidales bacterium]